MKNELTTQIEKQLAEFKPFETKLAEYKKTYDNIVYDMNDKKHNKQARSDQRAIGTVVANLDRKHAEIKAPLLELTKLVDGKRKEIKDDLQNVQGKIKSQIKQHEAAKAEHESMLKSKLELIRCLSVFQDVNISAKTIESRLKGAESLTLDKSYEHYLEEAEIELSKQIEKLTAMYEAAVKSEAEAAELEKLRKEAAEREARERDERLKAEAAEAARIESERKAAAEIARIEAEKKQAIIDAENAKKKAEQDAINAKLEADRQAEQAVIMERMRAEKEAAEAKAKAKAEQDAIDKRNSQKKHISMVLGKVKKSFIDAGFAEKDAIKITELLRDNKISNAQINW